MKLTELAIDRFGACRNVRLGQFTNGLNVLFGPPGTGKTTLQRYIGKVLFGFSEDHPQGVGHLVCHHKGQAVKLTRPALSAGELSVEDLSTNPQPTEPIHQYLGQLAPDLFETIYHFDSNQASPSIHSIIQALRTSRVLMHGKSAWTESIASFSEPLEPGMPGVEWNPALAEIRKLEDRRSQRLSEAISNRSVAPTPRVDLEAEIDELTVKIQQLDLQPLRDRIDTTDAKIRETRALLESAQAAPMPAESLPEMELLSACYDHLDDLDQQIMAWREFQSEVQAQRRRRRDELAAGIDGEFHGLRHPYQQVRHLLKSLQQRLNDAETASHQVLERLPSNDGEHPEAPVMEVLEGYEQIRAGLRQLFAELERENRKINQRAAAAELKHLRIHYRDIGKRLEQLMERRESVLTRIEALDNSAMEASLHSNPAYRYCAAEEGHWVTRRRFLGEIHDVPDSPGQSTSTRLRQRLTELQNERRDLVLQLVDHENHLGPMKTRLADLCSQRMTIAWDTKHPWDEELSRIESRLSQLERHLTESIASAVPAHTDPLLRRASQLANQMTLGEVTEINLSSSADGNDVQLITQGRHQDRIPYRSLRSMTQRQVALSLCLASVESLHRQGISFPMLIDEIWEEMDMARTKATFKLLDHFCRQGIQVLVTTDDRRLVSLALDTGIRLHELSRVEHCNRQWIASSRPQWVTVVEPAGALAEHEASLRRNTAVADVSTPITYPLADYTTANSQKTVSSNTKQRDDALAGDAEIAEPKTPGEAVSPADLVLDFAPLVDESTPLFNFELFTPSNSSSLKRCGIRDVSDLLKQDTKQLDPELSQHGFTAEIVETWQSIAWLMICVPGLRIEDAHLLRSIGIGEPEQLFTTTSRQLSNRLHRVLLTHHDHPVQWQPEDYSTERINRWYRALDRTRSRWQTSTGYSRQVYAKLAMANRTASPVGLNLEKPSSHRASLVPPPSGTENRGTRRRRGSRSANQDELSIGNSFDQRKVKTKAKTERTARKKRAKSLKFHLDLQDHVESAPSVNKKTAGRLQAIGVATIQELLAQSAESMAELMDCEQISAEMIETWQNQTELVCRIPNLRGHDAQILVACGITEPEMLNDMSADELFSIVQPFSETRQGIKIIRSGKKPDLDEVRNWIQWSNQNRKLQAA